MNSKYESYQHFLDQASFEIPDKVKQKLILLKRCIDCGQDESSGLNLDKDFSALSPDEVISLQQLNKSVQISMYHKAYFYDLGSAQLCSQ